MGHAVRQDPGRLGKGTVLGVFWGDDFRCDLKYHGKMLKDLHWGGGKLVSIIAK